MAKKNLFVFLGAYASEADARADYDVIGSPLAGAVGISSGRDRARTPTAGRLVKNELPTRHGAWTGIAAGAVLAHGPPSLIGTAAVGSIAGGVIGHLRGGMSRSDQRSSARASRPARRA